VSSTSGIFTGSSSYATDLQNVISRAVAIASLPINQLNADKTALSKQSDELNTIDGKVAALQDAVASISQALQSSFNSSVSDPSVLTPAIGSGAAEGSYSILVSDPGAYSTMMTKSWTASEETAHSYTLVVGGQNFAVNPTDDSAASVANAINKSYGDKVHATVVNVGPSDAPDYRISLQSVALTPELLDLQDNGASLEDRQTAGRMAQYEVNGSGTTVSSSSRTATIADGVRFTILKSSTTPVDLTITRSTSALGDALTSFVSSYNAVVSELDTQRGDAKGVLQGNAVVAQISSAVGSLVTYSGSGAFSGLRDLGLELQKDGTLKQNQFELIASDLQNSAGVTSFFDAFTTAAGGILGSLEDPTNGLIPTTSANMQAQLASLSSSIYAKQAQVDDLQTRLQDQMAAADALLATMEQQYNYMSSMFSAMQTAANQYK
jgi:flagellar hook-associated protein 2